MLNQDFKEFFQFLNESKVQYLIVGGYAVAFHGQPRYTKDIDVWVEISQENAARIVEAIALFGLSSPDLQPPDFLAPDRIIQIGYEPSRIDLLTTIPGVDFAECYPVRVTAEVDGVKVDFIDLNNLKKNKRASGRHQDLADIEKLE